MLALLLGQFPPNVVGPFWVSMGAMTQGDVVRVAKDPSGSRVLEAALAVPAAQEVREWVGWVGWVGWGFCAFFGWRSCETGWLFSWRRKRLKGSS